MDKAKVLYHDKLVCEASALSFVKGVSHHCATKTEILPQGFALRSNKKSTRFSEAQQWYLESKFKHGASLLMEAERLSPAIRNWNTLL